MRFVKNLNSFFAEAVLIFLLDRAQKINFQSKLHGPVRLHALLITDGMLLTLKTVVWRKFPAQETISSR